MVRAMHDGELRVEGRVSTGLRFSHADGTEYGAVMYAVSCRSSGVVSAPHEMASWSASLAALA